MAESRSRSVMLNPGMTGSGDSALQALKVPPHSVEAEQSLLGGLLPVSYTHLTLPTNREV